MVSGRDRLVPWQVRGGGRGRQHRAVSVATEQRLEVHYGEW